MSSSEAPSQRRVQFRAVAAGIYLPGSEIAATPGDIEEQGRKQQKLQPSRAVNSRSPSQVSRERNSLRRSFLYFFLDEPSE